MRGLAALGALALLGAAPERPLGIVAIDVEGGAATLYITSDGHSLLIDAGWPAGMGGGATSSAERIIATAREVGLDHLDMLLVSHYHVDHVGGAIALLRGFPVTRVVDHGPNRELSEGPAAGPTTPAALYPAYLAAIGTRPHQVMHAGETLRLGELSMTAVDADGAVISRPLPGAGEPGRACAGAVAPPPAGGEENPRSIGLVLRWGGARILALADTTADKELALVCPQDRIGPVDLMIVSHHGSAASNSAPLIATVRPRVAVMNNGRTKGGDARTVATLLASPRPAALWQLHFAERSPESNAPTDRIANPAGEADRGYALTVDVTRDAAVTVRNLRNGYQASYRR